MPRVYRPLYTRAIPPGAVPCTHKGRPAVRWSGRGGKTVVGVVCAGDPSRCRVESPVYRISYTGPDGRPKSEPGFTDRAASEALLAERVKLSARVKAGLLPPETLSGRRTLTELLDRFHAHVRHGGATVLGARRQHQRARDVCLGVGAARVADLTPPAVLGWLATLKAADRHGKKSFGPATAANYLASAKSFTRWCATVEKCEPVDHLSACRVSRAGAGDRHRRRSLAPADLARLLAAAKKSADAEFGLSGPERHALYLLASSTGLRAAELASLTPASFDAKNLTVTIERKHAKNRKGEVLPVPKSVMAAVKKLFGKWAVWPNRGKPSQAWWLRGAEMARRDLARAGVAAVEGGRVYDFHSLRGQFATDLDRAGVTLGRAQKLMRHSTPALSMKHYTRPDALELAAEVAKLPR